MSAATNAHRTPIWQRRRFRGCAGQRLLGGWSVEEKVLRRARGGGMVAGDVADGQDFMVVSVRADQRWAHHCNGVVHLRAIELSTLPGNPELTELLAESADELELLDGGKVVGVLLSPERAAQVAALEWLIADPERLERVLEVHRRTDARQAAHG